LENRFLWGKRDGTRVRGEVAGKGEEDGYAANNIHIIYKCKNDTC
jgi:hypothetical protein